MTAAVATRTTEPFAFMACIELGGRSVLVVGGGPIALEKTLSLRAVGADVTVVSRTFVPGLLDLDIERIERDFDVDDLDHRWLVVVATDDISLQGEIAEEAERRRLFCNVVDEPERCSLILPAVHREGPITIAVSTAGASPALAKRLRDDFAAQVSPRHADVARQLRSLRPWAKRSLPTYDERKEYFEGLVNKAFS